MTDEYIALKSFVDRDRGQPLVANTGDILTISDCTAVRLLAAGFVEFYEEPLPKGGEEMEEQLNGK